MNGIKEVFGVILDDPLPPAIPGAAVFILTDLLLSCEGVGHGVDSNRMLALDGGTEPNRGVSQDLRGKSTKA